MAIVTGSRADFGALVPLLRASAGRLDVRLLVTGAHLAPVFGGSLDSIEREGWRVAARIDSLILGGTEKSISESIGRGVVGFADALSRDRPDLLLVYGDRHEMLAAACAATPLRVPIAHVGGGENTCVVTTDVAYRAAITKLSHIHFVSVMEYRRKILRMGEEPSRIHVVGSLGVDSVMATPQLDWTELARDLELDPGRATVVLTYHPLTMRPQSTHEELAELLRALDAFPELQLVFTYPGADAGYSEIISSIESFRESHDNARVVKNLGSVRYVNLLRHARALVGNSSSGLIEAPSLGIPVVNVGHRQDDRIIAENVLMVPGEQSLIERALHRALADTQFISKARAATNPFGDGHAAERITRVLADLPLDEALLEKETAFAGPTA